MDLMATANPLHHGNTVLLTTRPTWPAATMGAAFGRILDTFEQVQRPQNLQMDMDKKGT